MADPKKPIDPQKEIEILVGELEERVDRLRAIYEQYFMGYEKLEPSVPRKDVDRRFVQLRKMNIRNTALKFRFNVVTQKFNTYAIYWTRICRQIEEGTFKRHVQRANKRFGPGDRGREQDVSIDIDLADFEVDIDDFNDEQISSVMDELDHDTTPPSPATAPPPAVAARPPRAPGFGAIEDDLGADTIPPASAGTPQPARVMRQAALPAGAKARVLVKKAPGSQPQPQSQPQLPTRAPMPSVTDGVLEGRSPSERDAAPPSRQPPQIRPRLPSVTDEAPRRPMPSSPDAAPSTSVIRASPAAAHVHRSPAGVVRPQISPSAQSVNRVPVAPAQSGQRIPAAPPTNPALGRPPGNPAPSVQKIPAAPPASANRVPVGLPSAGSVPRAPVAPPIQGAPTPPSPTAAAPRPPARPGGPMPVAPPRPPMPSAPESERGPVSRRPPPALPSQIKKT